MAAICLAPASIDEEQVEKVHGLENDLGAAGDLPSTNHERELGAAGALPSRAPGRSTGPEAVT